MQQWDFISKSLKNEFETAIVNELSVFEQLKFYCMFLFYKIVIGLVYKQLIKRTIIIEYNRPKCL